MSLSPLSNPLMMGAPAGLGAVPLRNWSGPISETASTLGYQQPWIAQRLETKREVFHHQQPIPEAQVAELVVFPRSNSVTINREGAFVPAAIFGENAILDYVIGYGPRGTELVLFAQPMRQARVVEPFRAELAWIRANRAAYVGRWIALSGSELLAVGNSAADVYHAAGGLGVEVPFVEFIAAEEDQLPFAGW